MMIRYNIDNAPKETVSQYKGLTDMPDVKIDVTGGTDCVLSTTGPLPTVIGAAKSQLFISLSSEVILNKTNWLELGNNIIHSFNFYIKYPLILNKV